MGKHLKIIAALVILAGGEQILTAKSMKNIRIITLLIAVISLVAITQSLNAQNKKDEFSTKINDNKFELNITNK